MGDRNNPIKFGPEWLRNLARERSAGALGPNSQHAPVSSAGGGQAGAAPAAPGSSTTTPMSGNSANASSVPQKIHLAKLRYGREEMLALYDRTVEAPSELKSIDQLYQPRGKPPFALQNTFEEDMRENLRSGPPIGGVMVPERFGTGRVIGRGSAVADSRGRPRMPYVRQPSLGRGNAFHPRIPGYGPAADEDTPSSPRSWSNSNGGPPTNRNVTEQPDWATNKTFRSKRPTSNTNWRSQTREEGEEWRLSDPGRSRTGQQDKWERDWGDRSNQDKSPSWNANRRTWGGDAQNEENLPEWAMDNAEACAGTFDALGAFHGYSNDDTNLPKTQDASYSEHKPNSNAPKCCYNTTIKTSMMIDGQRPNCGMQLGCSALTRSHTQGSVARLKSVEDGSEEWWASAKAKKLSPKKFDASDIKFKKQVSITAEDSGNTSSSSKQSSTSKEENNMTHEVQENPVTSPDSSDSGHTETTFSKNNIYRPQFSENKTFDALMRSDINMDEASDERGNFQSVTIKPNNSLRQKHQNIVATAAENLNLNSRQSAILQEMTSQVSEKELPKLTEKSPEDKIVEDIFDITLDDKDLLTKLPNVIGLPLKTSNPGVSPGKATMASSMAQISNPGAHKTAQSPNPPNPGNMHKSNVPMAGLQGPSLHQNSMHTLSLQPSGPKAPGMQSAGGHPHGHQAGLHSGIQAHGLPGSDTQASELQQSRVPNSTLQQTHGLQSPASKNLGMPSGMLAQGLQGSQLQGLQHGLQIPGMSAPGMQGLGLQSLGMQSSNMPPSMQPGIQPILQPGMQSTMQSGIQPGMQSGLQSGLQPLQPGMQTGLQNSGIQNIGISNAALNSAMRLQGPRLMEQSHANNSMGIPLQRMSPPPLYLNPGINNTTMGASGMHPGSTGITGFPDSSTVQGINTNNSLFGLGQNPNSAPMPPSNDIQMPNHGQSKSFPMHGLQHSGSQGPFASLYGNMMRHSPPQNNPNSQSLSEHWYYEDPKKNIQGPFSSKEMYNWYRAGFFSSTLMVKRACDTHMRPLGSYGSVVPFAQVDMAGFPMSSGFGLRNQGSHDSIMNSQSGLGLDVINVPNVSVGDNSMDNLQFGTVGLVRNPPFGQQPMVDSLWGQPSTSPDLMWMQQSMKTRNDMRVNNLPLYFWDQPPSAVSSNALLSEEIVKEMKTEDQILAQLRAQSAGSVPNMPFLKEPSATTPANINPEEAVDISATPNLEELHKLIQADSLSATGEPRKPDIKEETKNKSNNKINSEQSLDAVKVNENKQEAKDPARQNKAEPEKSTKTKEAKTKNKKTKEEKKDPEIAIKEEDSNKSERKSEESSPAKKKDDKLNKKELEKEKKEWIKEGFTIVKGSEKNAKEKKKTDETKTAEEAERKRKEEERLAAEDEKKKKQAEALKKQQEQKQQRPLSEAAVKKAPWSVGAAALAAPGGDGPTLAEIQRLEREKKLEHMKEQQLTMQALAQQQAAALAREQEMQTSLGWAKKKLTSAVPGLSLAEIQAEARQQSVAAGAAGAAAAAAAALEEAAVAPQVNNVPWGNTHNGGGFWDSPPPAQPVKPVEKTPELPRVVEPKIKKKNTLNVPAKKEASPGAQFDAWCNAVLASWSAKIDVPTFVGFLKDIESPYEVKDYVKCYLDESKESSDFARQFLEKRSKLLRVGMVTPSDDLCSPAVAVNPRTTSGSDYQEVKGKGKKTKKNKMLKVDARILGFSVTAAEDRINVGDIDTVRPANYF